MAAPDQLPQITDPLAPREPSIHGPREMAHVAQLVHDLQSEPGAVVGQNSPLACFVAPPAVGDPEAQNLALPLPDVRADVELTRVAG